MTNRERLEAHKSVVAKHVRRALKAQLEIWDADSDIEDIVGEIGSMGTVLQHLAIGYYRAEQIEQLTEDEAVEIVAKCLVDPDGDITATS